jgi:hypothetical protein
VTIETEKVDHGRPVVIAQATSLPQADVICAMLRTVDIEGFILNEHTSQLLPHLDLLINPKGIQIAVRQADAQAAREQLGKHEHGKLEEEDQDPAAERNLTDSFARAAAVSGVFAVFVNVLVVIIFWYYFRARKSAKTLPPTDVILFKRNMRVAKLCMVAAAAIITCLIAITI